jgi:sugar transferase (PEP-CTERM/EpsH1 system associated)
LGVPNLLFLTQRLPYPPIKGEKIRPLELLRYLGKSFDVHLGCLIDDPADWTHVPTVRALCADLYTAKLDRKRAKLLCLRGLATGQPLSVTFFEDRGLRRWIAHKLETLRPEAIFVCSSNMAPYVLDHPYRAPTEICDLADVDSEKWRAYAAKAGFPMGWVYGREARLTFALERRVAREMDYATFVSGAEADLFHTLVPECEEKILGISSGVDLAYYAPDAKVEPVFDTAKPSYAFVGTMDYPPNVDAVGWFASTVLPLIRRRLPQAQFYIVGSNPTPAVTALAKIDGVHVTGRVADVRPYMKFASANVAPMRIARGIQNKVLQPMAMGLVTVVTPDALEGIEAEGGREVLLAADAESFAAACVRAAETDLKPSIGAAAHRRMVERYGWAARLSGFDPLLGINAVEASPRRAGMAP